MDKQEIREMRREIRTGKSDAECDECGRYYRVEPDASFECNEEGCNGTVQSKLRKNGMI